MSALPRPICILQVYYANHLTGSNLNLCQLLSELSESHLDILSDQMWTWTLNMNNPVSSNICSYLYFDISLIRKLSVNSL